MRGTGALLALIGTGIGAAVRGDDVRRIGGVLFLVGLLLLLGDALRERAKTGRWSRLSGVALVGAGLMLPLLGGSAGYYGGLLMVAGAGVLAVDWWRTRQRLSTDHSRPGGGL